MNRIEIAEDIVQDTLATAVEYWQHKGIPPNTEAWLYTTAKNKALNFLRDKKIEIDLNFESAEESTELVDFSDDSISDEQLKVMLKCCHPSISEEVQTTLILKVICGFSISEIASAFQTNTETINKRLVRGRKKLREPLNSQKLQNGLDENIEVLLKTIYLLFNEGYSPQRKNQLLRVDLCFEAIRLTELITSNIHISEKRNAHALLSLMYLNASRFEARLGLQNEVIGMKEQDRSLWNQALINKGLYHLGKGQLPNSKYLILATISANHCLAISFEKTNWSEIITLYDVLLVIENSPVIQMNRLVAVAYAQGVESAIWELRKLEGFKEIKGNHLYYSMLADFLKQSKEYGLAAKQYEKAISFCKNERDKIFLKRKLAELVPLSDAHV